MRETKRILNSEGNLIDGRLFMGVSKPTEMFIWDMLQEELRKRGVTVVPEFSVSTRHPQYGRWTDEVFEDRQEHPLC